MQETLGNVGNPHRDAETGLVDEQHAADFNDEGYGDGVTIVDFTVEANFTGTALEAVAWVYASMEQAPLDSIGRSMPGHLTQGDNLRAGCVPDREAARQEIMVWAERLGLSPAWVSTRVDVAYQTWDAAEGREQLIDAFIRNLPQVNVPGWKLADEVINELNAGEAARDVKNQLRGFGQTYGVEMLQEVRKRLRAR